MVRYIEHNFIITLSPDDLHFTFQDDFEMMKDVDISGDFVSNEEDTSESIKEKEVKEWSISLLTL